MGEGIIGAGVDLAIAIPFAVGCELKINEGQSVVIHVFVESRNSRFLPLPLEKQPLQLVSR